MLSFTFSSHLTGNRRQRGSLFWVKQNTLIVLLDFFFKLQLQFHLIFSKTAENLVSYVETWRQETKHFLFLKSNWILIFFIRKRFEHTQHIKKFPFTPLLLFFHALLSLTALHSFLYFSFAAAAVHLLYSYHATFYCTYLFGIGQIYEPLPWDAIRKYHKDRL